MKVFPTPVGVFLIVYHAATKEQSLPHARGGVSIIILILRLKTGSSPRPWGCFYFFLL